MRYRQLGSGSLRVSEISLTTSGGVERRQAIACVRRGLELGINFIDTANVYGRGASEIALAEALSHAPRDSYVLATKLYFPMSNVDGSLSRTQILRQIDASLARLKVDHVDHYQCHRYDPQTLLEETMAALTEIVRAGKARYIGFSEWPANKIAEGTAMAGVEHFVSSQPQYSMLWRKPEAQVIPFCRAHGISQIVWSPLGQGVLTGKYQAGASVPSDSRAANSAMNFAFPRNWLRRSVLQLDENAAASDAPWTRHCSPRPSGSCAKPTRWRCEPDAPEWTCGDHRRSRGWKRPGRRAPFRGRGRTSLPGRSSWLRGVGGGVDGLGL
jgi:aryl-alcohol dehydrogenase-like predicted oxidoreductase